MFASCEKLFDACALQGDILPDFLQYTDPESLCYALWEAEKSKCDRYYPGSNGLVCQLDLQVAKSNCLSMLEPSEQLIKYHQQKFSEEGLEYPSACDTTDIKQLWTLIGVIVGPIVGCLIISLSAFGIIHYCKNKK